MPNEPTHYRLSELISVWSWLKNDLRSGLKGRVCRNNLSAGLISFQNKTRRASKFNPFVLGAGRVSPARGEEFVCATRKLIDNEAWKWAERSQLQGAAAEKIYFPPRAKQSAQSDEQIHQLVVRHAANSWLSWSGGASYLIRILFRATSVQAREGRY